MLSIEVDGFYTLCMRDAIRPMHTSAPSLGQAAADLVWVARARGIEQSRLLSELESASRTVEWVTPYEIEVHTRAVRLGRMAIESAYATHADMPPDARLRQAHHERPMSY